MQIPRTTIYYWMRHDEAFIAAINAWRRRTRQQAADELVVMIPRAMSTLRRAVYNDDNLKAALLVLRSQGLFDRRKQAKPRGRKRTSKLTPNVVMEHSRTTVAMAVPPPQVLPEKKQVRELPEAGQEE